MHKPREGVVLDAEGRDTGDRWVFCATCGETLGMKKALPFGPVPTAAYEGLLTQVA